MKKKRRKKRESDTGTKRERALAHVRAFYAHERQRRERVIQKKNL